MPSETPLPAIRRACRLPLPATAVLVLLVLAWTTACHTTTGTASVASEPPPAAAGTPASPEPTAASDAEEAPAAEESPAAEEAPPAAEAESTEEPYNNTIKWSTASELDNFGFDVFRGDSAEGPFERINPDTIEGAGTSDEPSRYQYVDDTIDPYKTYYYYVESISMNSVRERFTPVGKAGPKIKPEAAAEPKNDG